MSKIEFHIVRDSSRGQLPRYKRCAGFALGTVKSRKQKIVIDLEYHWKTSQTDARRLHRNTFYEFFKELLDTIDHEYAHVFEPFRFRRKDGEKLAQQFAREARLLRQFNSRRF